MARGLHKYKRDGSKLHRAAHNIIINPKYTVLAVSDQKDKVTINIKGALVADVSEAKKIADELQNLNVLEGHEYEVLRAKQNIAELFQNVKTKNRLVRESE